MTVTIQIEHPDTSEMLSVRCAVDPDGVVSVLSMRDELRTSRLDLLRSLPPELLTDIETAAAEEAALVRAEEGED